MKKVLVVDDNVAVGHLIRSQLRRVGCESHFFCDAEEAIREFEAIRPDLAVLDFGLPDMTGSELFERIRKLPSGATIPVVFVTGAVEPEDVEGMRAQGAAAVVSKPFSPRQFQALVKGLLALE